MVAVMPGDDGDAHLQTHIQTHIHPRTLSHPPTPTHTHTHTLTLTLTLTPPRTFTLTQSDPPKNKMHIWGSPRRVIK